MVLARAMKIFTLVEQPVHRATGGLENLPRFQEMVKTHPARSQVLCKKQPEEAMRAEMSNSHGNRIRSTATSSTWRTLAP